jgi:hypothetical protein
MANKQLDDLVRLYAQPVFSAAGFRKRGRQFALAGPGGRVGFAAFYPHDLPQDPGFWLQYGMIVPARLEWLADKLAGEDVSLQGLPLLSQALVSAYAACPAQLQRGDYSAHTRRNRWPLRLSGDDAELGADLGAALQSKVIPDLRWWFDPDSLADSIEEMPEGFVPLVNPRQRAVALNLVDAGPSERLDSILKNLPEGDELRKWIARRLAG